MEGLAGIISDFFNSIDPQETLAAQDFRSAKALFVPSLKRDIVPLLRAHDLRREGSHGNPYPTAAIHIHTGRRCGGVATRGARAASRARAPHWRPQRWQQRGRSGRPGAPRGIPTRVATVGLDSRTKRAD